MKNKKAKGIPCSNMKEFDAVMGHDELKPQQTPMQFVSRLPWKIETDSENGDRVIVDSDGIVVCRRPDPDDAAFIVKAVNCYQEMLDTLKLMDTIVCPSHGELRKRVRQAIAKAEGSK